MQSVTPEAIRRSVFHVVFMFVIGSLVALFIGLGVNAFYPGKQQPDYPRSSSERTVADPATDAKFEADMKAYDDAFKAWEEENKTYSRNVGLIVAVLAAITLAVGMLITRFSTLLSDGALLGGAISMFYAIIRASDSDDPRAQFMVVTIALVSVVVVAYLKFIRSSDSAS